MNFKEIQKKQEDKSLVVSFRMTPTEHKQLKNILKKEGLELSHFIRELIRLYLKETK